MKRFLSILFIISCLFTLVTPALAASSEDDDASYYTIHTRIPGDYRPTLYAWNSRGDQMSKSMSPDGKWYTIQIPDHYEYIQIAGNIYNSTDKIKIPGGGKEFWVVCDTSWKHTISMKEPESAHPTAKLHVYAPNAKRIQVDIWYNYLWDPLLIHDFEDQIQLSPSEDKGWWEGYFYTDMRFVVNGDLDCLTEHPLGILDLKEETWIVLDENGNHQISQEEPDIPEPIVEEEDSPSVMVYVLIGVGVVALAGIATVVVLILRKKRS